MRMKIFNALFIITFVQACNLFADDNSARRYAALDRNAVTDKLFLLSIKEVQDNLKLTQQQIQLLQTSSSSLTNDPAIQEWRRSHKQLLATAHSNEERTKIRQAENEKYSLLIEQYEETMIQKNLLPMQTRRLQELFLQMKGPHVILEDTNISQELKLTQEQINRMNDDPNLNGQLLSLLRHRFLGLQIQTWRKRDPDDVDAEIKCVARVIKEVEKDQEDDLLNGLNEEQHRSWDNLCGKPLSINWKIDYFSDAPFQN